jgi:hypothetical protein
MGRRRIFWQTGLLIMKIGITLIFFLLINFVIYAQEKEFENDRQNVSLQTSYEISPIAGKPWLFTLIIDYFDPEQITVIEPVLNFLSLDRTIKSPRLIENHLQTVIDYRFIPMRSGSFTIESFKVIYPSGVTATEPFILNINAENESQRLHVLQLAWENIPPKFEKGEKAAILLRLNVSQGNMLHGNEVSWQFPRGFFTPEVPAGMILSPLQLTEEEKEKNIYAKFDVIPLEGNIFLPSRELQFENIVCQIPALRIAVTDRSWENTIEILGENTTVLLDNAEELLFPSITDENNKRRTIHLICSYSILALVIITVFICLYLLLKERKN